jgi:hypothetical protein
MGKKLVLIFFENIVAFALKSFIVKKKFGNYFLQGKDQFF